MLLYLTIFLSISVFSCQSGFASSEIHRFNAKTTSPEIQELTENYGNDQEDIFITNYSTVYFSNLNKNFGVNSHGTCSYVSLAMLLSFYDSYWNDSYIEEDFEQDSYYEAPTHLPGAMFNPSFDTESPGIISEEFEDVTNYTLNEYKLFIEDTTETYFQSYLISLAYEMFDNYCFETANSYGMTLYEQTHLLSYYLVYQRNITSLEAVVSSYNNNEPNFNDEIIGDILDGVPLLLNIYSPTFGYHSVIAYDYDEIDDEIYVHAGWKNSDGVALTHISLSQLNVTSIDSALKIQNNNLNSPNPPSHYHVIDSYYSCTSSDYIYPHNLHIIGGNYTDVIPTFEWESLYEEKWYADSYPFIKLTIFHEASDPIYTRYIYSGNKYTLGITEWNYLCNVDTEKTYFVSVSIMPSTFLSYEDVRMFRKPHATTISHLIVPTDYGYSDAYPTDSYTSETFVNHTTVLGYSFETRRYRTGYIHNECVVLSSKKVGINNAFIEYKFNEGIDRIDIQLSYWREISNEELTSSNGSAKLEVRTRGKFDRKINLLSSTTSLSDDRNYKSSFTICFEKPIYQMRISAKTFGINTNTWNKGRICIGNLKVYTPGILRTNGYELDYNPDYWNDYFKTTTVCYNYALDSTIYSYMTIGESYEGNFDLYSNIEYYVEYDSNHLVYHNQLTNEEVVGFILIPLDSINTVCPDGTYKVALFVDPIAFDYHWYRQNSDGTWSHKPSIDSVRDFDSNGSIIYNPLLCSRQESSRNYTDYIGCYAVTPLRRSWANEEWMEVN